MSNGHPWTANDTATLRRMNAAGYSNGEIAQHTGHAEITIRKHLEALGLPSCRRKAWLIRFCSEFNRRPHAHPDHPSVALHNSVRPSV